ncbi:MAG: MBL fold metallo-hydrolase RNA specificity domain-containing protein [Arhodomonas sp.]|nr:MBL fold metallo-hydrolase RNA specificity domain-containing protein [Arhodomonas sp.]
MRDHWNREARRRLRRGRHPLAFDTLYTVDGHDEHERTVAYLARTGRPAVVLAASGMAAGGRVVNYLNAMLGDPRHQVLFVGYQAEGTPGRRHRSATAPTAAGWSSTASAYDIRAGVATISGYSAHADRDDLIRFVRRMKRPPGEIRVVHGEPQARAALREALTESDPGRTGSMTREAPMASHGPVFCGGG